MNHLNRNYHTCLQAIWNLRHFGWLLIGPVVGVILVSLIFNMPDTLRLAAGGMLVLILALYSLLLRGELKRLRALRHRV